MENILLTLVVILLVLVLIMLVGLGILGFKILKNRGLPLPAQDSGSPPPLPAEASDRFHPEIRKRMEEAKLIKRKSVIEATCTLHPAEPSEGSCAICGKYFCAACLKTHRTLTFCREHLNVFHNAQWTEVYTVKSTPDDPEAGVKVVEWKNNAWELEQLPLYVETHYKINVEGDQIESWIVLFAREDEVPEIKKRLHSPVGNAAALS